MKKAIALLLCLCVLLTTALSLAEHEHTWGEWVPDPAGGHTAVCADDDEVMNAKHYTFAGNFGGTSYSVCAVCGQCKDQIFALIDGAEAVSTKAKPSNQRGALIVRGMEAPFETDPSIVYAFTVAYIQNGALATWKDVSTVSVPLPVELPEGYQLVRLQPSSGDDSVQNPEQRIEMESTLEDGVLTFTTKTPALYLIQKAE